MTVASYYEGSGCVPIHGRRVSKNSNSSYTPFKKSYVDPCKYSEILKSFRLEKSFFGGSPAFCSYDVLVVMGEALKLTVSLARKTC